MFRTTENVDKLINEIITVDDILTEIKTTDQLTEENVILAKALSEILATTKLGFGTELRKTVEEKLEEEGKDPQKMVKNAGRVVGMATKRKKKEGVATTSDIKKFVGKGSKQIPGKSRSPARTGK